MARWLKVALGFAAILILGLSIATLVPRPKPVRPSPVQAPPIVKGRLPKNTTLAFHLGIDEVTWGPRPGQMVTATWADKGFLTLWDLATGRMLAQRKLNSAPTSVAVEPRTGRVLVACFGWGSEQMLFEAWAPDLSKRLWRWTLGGPQEPGKPSRFSFPLGTPIHPSRRFVIVEDRLEGKLLACDARTGKVLKTFDTGKNVWAVFFDPTGRRMAVSLSTSELQVWDLLTGRMVGRARTPIRDISEGSFCPDGRRFVCFGFLERKFAALDLKTGKVLLKRKCEQLAPSPDGTYVLLLPSLELWDLRKLAPVGKVRVDLPAKRIRAAWLSPNASGMLAVDDEGRWHFFDLWTRREIASSPPSAPAASALSFVAPERLLVAAESLWGRRAALALWDVASLRQVCFREIPTESLIFRIITRLRGEWLGRFAFHSEIPASPNGELIAVPLYDRVDIYRTKPRLERVASIRRRTPSAPYPNGGCVLPKHKLVVVHEGKYPNTYLAAYDLESGELRWTCSVDILSVPRSTLDEGLILVGTWSGIFVLNPATGNVVGTLGPAKPAGSLSLSGTGLVAARTV
ncbi:hypothetical protein DRO33_03090, partial [Candidatus Bathyarchaeota archaeon]